MQPRLISSCRINFSPHLPSLMNHAINITPVHAMLATTQRLGARQPGVVRQAGRAAVVRQTQQRQQLPAGRLTHTGPVVGSGESRGNQSGGSWWSRLWSGTGAQFFAQKKLTPQQFKDDFVSIIYRTGEWTLPNGNARFYRKFLFDDNDLQKAIKLIDDNIDLINHSFEGTSLTWNREVWSLNPAYSPFGPVKQTNLADMLFDAIFCGDEGLRGSFKLFVASEMKVKLVELFHYMIDKGARITPELKPAYNVACLEIMRSLELMYEGYSTLRDADYEIIAAEKILHNLISILEKLMPESEYQATFNSIKQKLAYIEKHRQEYKAKKQDERDRDDYMDDKRRQKRDEYRARYGGIPGDYEDEDYARKYAQFNEAEYQQWLKNGKTFKLQVLSLDDPIAGLIQALKLPENTTEREMWNKFRTVRREDHPDKVQPLIDAGTISKEKGEKRIAYYTDVMSAYNAYKAARKTESDE